MRACRLLLGERGPQGNRIPDCPVIIEKLVGVTAMEAYQWFLLGMMVVWTPGLLALALLLWRSNIDDMGQNSADNSILQINHTTVPLHKSVTSSARAITNAGHSGRCSRSVGTMTLGKVVTLLSTRRSYRALIFTRSRRGR